MTIPPPIAAAAASARVRVIHDRPADPAGAHVLYWMIGARRTSWNYALDRAVDWARHLQKPLLVLEALRCDYRWASDRFHRFVLDGMRDNLARFEALGIGYYPYVEPAPGAGRGLLRALAASAAVIVTDRSPVFELPQLVAAAGRQVTRRFEEVDGNGIVPLDAPPPAQVFPTAYAFRRYLQRTVVAQLKQPPRAQPVAPDLLTPAPLPVEVQQRWPAADRRLLDGSTGLARLAIDHGVPPIADAGGAVAARRHLTQFIDDRLPRYADARNHPDDDAGSRLSAYLHFGHISAHEIVSQLLRRERWTPARCAKTASGAKEGWWGVSPAVEAFLDQVITWRELGFNMCERRDDYDRFDSLPPWAIATLEKHARDPRPHVYTLEQFAAASTHDPIWNAAQRQLTTEGRIHNYLRMLWGKKIVEWTASPREALDVMIELNNRYAVDGRDPNSYSGIFWVLGRYDRPWAPERPIFGTVRYMTSANTARKLHLKQYVQRYGPALI